MCTIFEQLDLDRIDALQPEGWSDIGPFFRFYAGHSFCRPVKIEDEGMIVGVGAAIFNRGTAWLAHIIVHPQWRRKGMGERITRGLIKVSEDAGIDVQLLVATDMGQPLYEQLGFEETCRYVFHSKANLDPVTPTVGMRTLDPLQDREGVLKLDHRVTGEDRSDMVLTACGRGWVVDGAVQGELVGYYLPDLGDGAVLATETGAGVDLLRMRLGEGNHPSVMPEQNEAALSFLSKQGINAEKTAARMVRGGRDSLQGSQLFQRVGGHFG